MKKILLILLVACQSAFAQKEALDFKNQQLKAPGLLPTEFKETFAGIDFSKLFTITDESQVFGFIGDDYERIRIKIISVTKNKQLPGTYDVYGKSMVKSNVDQFHGTLKITSIRKQKVMSYGVDDHLKGRGLKGEYVIVGDYFFSEPKDEKHSGTFKGAFESDFYLDKNGRPNYDDLDNYADGFSNNQFVGQWASYNGKIVQRCNWGDYRIPNSGDLQAQCW